ncbi:methionyl-tRNA formyltransferase [Anaeromassilibacillus senegalensis]|uniref:methionyl-tRNA formyltransferase n=1 Tax=Anaeromassilibacillus senegalensis TaxID=1673717 RepID=UPI0006804D15|nr:methionyl-tRNA formyltransferase [Anaeromassilibacillus senegalensis]
MRMIFMGTPEFAVPCLQSLLDAGHEICAVYTQPDKPKGRGYALTPPPVKVLAEQNGLRVLQPKTLRTPEAAQEIRDLCPACIVVVAYGKILPKEILEIPRYGCINVHASLLPKYRGAAPIQWAVINGEPVSGVTTMYMAEGLDTGDMLLKAETEIGPEETAGELHDRLSQMGAKLIVETMDAVQNGTVQRTPQGDADTSYASMLTKELGNVDWSKPAEDIHNLVRGLSPWPVAFTQFHGKRLKIHRSRVAPGFGGAAGSVQACKDCFIVACGGQSALELQEVQYEGGKRMKGKDFLCGHRLDQGGTLG